MARRRNVPEAVQASVEVQPSLGHLLDRWRAGDQRAAEAIFRRYEKRLRQFVHAKLGNYLQTRLDSDDMVASVFESAFRRLAASQPGLDPSVSLIGWVYKIAQGI